jgi:HSP20 family protein
MPRKDYDDDYDDEHDESDESDDGEKDEKNDRIIWTKDSRWNDPFEGGDFFENFNIPENFEKIIENFMKRFNLPQEDASGKPVIWGFSMRMGPDKKPVIKPIGKYKQLKKPKSNQNEPDALIDLIEDNKVITVIAEISGVNISDINLRPTEMMVSISVDTPDQKYYNEIILPCKVDPKSASILYNNGILEVKLTKKNKNEVSNLNLK